MNEQLKKQWLEYLTDRVNSFDYSEVDGFFEDYSSNGNDVSESDIEDLLNIPKVVAFKP